MYTSISIFYIQARPIFQCIEDFAENLVRKKKKEKGYLTSGDHLAGATMHDETGCCLFEACVPLKEYRHHCCEVCRF